MKRIPLIGIVTALVLSVSACAKSGPVTLSLAASQSRTGEVRLNADSAFSEPDALPVPVTYSVVGTLPYLGDRLLAWSIGRRVKPSGELQKLATSFGVDGETEKVGEFGYIATDASKERSINLWADDAGGWWSYSNFSAQSGSGVSEPSCAPDTTCEVSPPVATVPKDLIEPGDALRRTNQYLSRADMVPLNYALTATKTDYATEVYGPLTLGGVETNIGVTFVYGDDGELMSASGPMITIAMAGRYPIVSPMEAVKRLSNPLYGAIGGAVRVAADVAVSSAVGAPSSSGTSSSDTSTSDEPIDIPITSVRLILMEARLSNGTHMLLPAYTYSNSDGDVGTVIALTDDVIAFRKNVTESTVSTSPIDGGQPEPAPVDPAPIPQTEADSLVGLTESEATAAAKDNGWIVRIASRDGKDFMLTTDYVTNRVNLTIKKSVVTSVDVG
jgi:hypothetical protein